MAKTQVEFKLDDSVSSLQDLKSLILEIRQYAKWFEHAAIKKQVGSKSRKKADTPSLTPTAESVISAWKSREPSLKNFDQLIATLEDYAASAPQFTIVLAAPPSSALKRSLVSWCRQNLSHNMLINFQFNSTILGGMVVRCGSHIYDWSFRKQILGAGQKFPEVLRRV